MRDGLQLPIELPVVSGRTTIRSKDHLIAFVAIAFISILARRLKRLVVEELSA